MSSPQHPPYGVPSPYGAPPPYGAGPPSRPPVLSWYQAYCGLMIGIYLLAAAGIGLLLAFVPQAEVEMADRISLGLVAVLSFLFLCVYAAALFLPRRPWAWIVHIVLICLGMTSACTLPAAIPLLIYWLRPETQAYFGRHTAPPPVYPPGGGPYGPYPGAR